MEEIEERNWVQCDACQKWRSIACTKEEYKEVQAMTRWTCGMNRWDPSRTSCSQPEDVVIDSAIIVTSVGGGTPQTASPVTRLSNGVSASTIAGRRKSGQLGSTKGIGRGARGGRNAPRGRVISRVPQQRIIPKLLEDQIAEMKGIPLQQVRHQRSTNTLSTERTSRRASTTLMKDQESQAIVGEESGEQELPERSGSSLSIEIRDKGNNEHELMVLKNKPINENHDDNEFDEEVELGAASGLVMPRLRPRRSKESQKQQEEESPRLNRSTSIRSRRSRIDGKPVKLRRAIGGQPHQLGQKTLSQDALEYQLSQEEVVLDTKVEAGSDSESSDQQEVIGIDTGAIRKRRTPSGVHGNEFLESSCTKRLRIGTEVQAQSLQRQPVLPLGIGSTLLQQQRTPANQPQLQTIPWVQCELCQKWRILYGCSAEEYESLNASEEPWTCAQNKWDPARSSCDAPEETTQPASECQSIGINAFNSALTHALACLYRRVLLTEKIKQAEVLHESRHTIDKLTEQLNERVSSDDVVDQFPLKGYPWNELPLVVLESLYTSIASPSSKTLRGRTHTMSELRIAWHVTRVLLMKHLIANTEYFLDSVAAFSSCCSRILSFALQDPKVINSQSFKDDKNQLLFFSEEKKEFPGVVSLLEALINFNQTPSTTSRSPVSHELTQVCEAKQMQETQANSNAFKDRIIYLIDLFNRLSDIRLHVDNLHTHDIEAVLEFFELLEISRNSLNPAGSKPTLCSKKSSIVFKSEFGLDLDHKLKKMLESSLPGKKIPEGLIFNKKKHQRKSSVVSPLFHNNISPPVTLFRLTPSILELHPLSHRLLLSGGSNVPQIVVTETLPRVVTLHPVAPLNKLNRHLSLNTNGGGQSTVPGSAAPPPPKAPSPQTGPLSSQNGSLTPGVASSSSGNFPCASATLTGQLIGLTYTGISSGTLIEGLNTKESNRIQLASKNVSQKQLGSSVQLNRPIAQPCYAAPIPTDSYELDLPSRIPWPGTEDLSAQSDSPSSVSCTSDSTVVSDKDSVSSGMSDWDEWEDLINRKINGTHSRDRGCHGNRLVGQSEISEVKKQLSSVTKRLMGRDRFQRLTCGEKLSSNQFSVCQQHLRIPNRFYKRWIQFHQGDLLSLGSPGLSSPVATTAVPGTRRLMRGDSTRRGDGIAPLAPQRSTSFNKVQNSHPQQPSTHDSPFPSQRHRSRSFSYRTLGRQVSGSGDAIPETVGHLWKSNTLSPCHEQYHSASNGTSFIAIVPDSNGIKSFFPLNSITSGSNDIHQHDMHPPDWSLKSGLTILNGRLLRVSRSLTVQSDIVNHITRTKSRENSPIRMKKKRKNRNTFQRRLQIPRILERIESTLYKEMKRNINGNELSPFDSIINNSENDSQQFKNDEHFYQSWNQYLYRIMEINQLSSQDEFPKLCVLISALNKFLHRYATSLDFLHGALFSTIRNSSKRSQQFRNEQSIPSEQEFIEGNLEEDHP